MNGKEILQNAFKDTLAYYLGLEDHSLQKHFFDPLLATKERVQTLDDLQVIIYSNDHNPPHFHVKTKDGRIDAKFKIENGQLLSGSIGAKDLKKVEAFCMSAKGKLLLQTVWNKRL